MVRPYRPPLPLKGHIFSYGKTESGKTWKNLALAQFYYLNNYKIWDIFGGLRKEGPFWAIPSDEINLWKQYCRNVGLTYFTGPREFKVDFYIPIFKSKIPKKVPESKPRVTANFFTINFKSLTAKDLSVIMGGVPTNQERILKKIQKDLPDDANSEDILQWFNETNQRKKMKRFPIYYSFFEPLCEERLFEGPKGKYILNLKEISKERNRVFVLFEEFIPEEVYRYFFVNYITRILFELVNNNKIHIYNLTLLREISSFMKIEDSSSQYSDQKQNLRNEFSNQLRYGRSGVFVICDTQSPREVKSIVPGQEGLICLNRLPGDKDREEACERPRKDGRMNSTHVAYLGVMPIQEMAVLEQGKPIRKIDFVQPPMTMAWKPETGNFLSVWKEKYNSYLDTYDLLKDIEEINKPKTKKEDTKNTKEEEDIVDEGDIELESDEELNPQTETNKNEKELSDKKDEEDDMDINIDLMKDFY